MTGFACMDMDVNKHLSVLLNEFKQQNSHFWKAYVFFIVLDGYVYPQNYKDQARNRGKRKLGTQKVV